MNTQSLIKKHQSSTAIGRFLFARNGWWITACILLFLGSCHVDSSLSMLYSECEIDNCDDTPIGDSGGDKCTDVVSAPHLPYSADFYMGVTQGPGCGGHVGRLSEAYDFSIEGKGYESSHMMLAVAANSGTVVETRNDILSGCFGCTGSDYAGGWGNHVVVQVDRLDGSGPSCFYERYAHLITNSVLVKKGDHICRGQTLGRIGTTGNSTGEHLHFQRELASHQSVRVDFQEASVPSGCNKCLTYSHLTSCYKSMNTQIDGCGMPVASCTDGRQNGNETDPDCGGSCAKCLDGKKCAVSTDCQSNRCSGNMCMPTTLPGPCSGPILSISWMQRAPLSEPDRPIISAVLDGKIHTFGWTTWPRHRIYDPVGNSWSEKNYHPYSIVEGAAISVGSTLFTFGDGNFAGGYAFRYEPLSDSWTKLAANPWPRRLSGIGAIGGKIYIAGGFAGYGGKVNVYDSVSNTWADLAPLSAASGVLSSVVHNGKLYIFGGDADPSQAQVYDPASNRWSALPRMPVRHYGGKAFLHNNGIWLLGGSDDDTVDGSVSIYDLTQNKWCSGSKLPESLRLFAGEQVNNQFYLIGGFTTGDVLTDHVWQGIVP